MDSIFGTIGFLFSAIAFAIAGTLIIRKIFGHEHLSRHNEIGGFIYAVIGVIYAVLLAFVVIEVWDDFQEAQAYVDNEAKVVSNIYILSSNFESETTTNLQDNVLKYLESVIKEDWLLMQSNTNINDFHKMPSDIFFDEFEILLQSISLENEIQKYWYDKLLAEFTELNSARNFRFYSTRLAVPSFIWLVIIFGGLLTVFYAMLFSSENLWAQLLMISILSVSLAIVIHLIYALDHPFRGIITVSPESFEMVLKSII